MPTDTDCQPVRVGVARDLAFGFYYREYATLDLFHSESQLD